MLKEGADCERTQLPVVHLPQTTTGVMNAIIEVAELTPKERRWMDTVGDESTNARWEAGKEAILNPENLQDPELKCRLKS